MRWINLNDGEKNIINIIETMICLLNRLRFQLFEKVLHCCVWDVEVGCRHRHGLLQVE